MARQYRNKISLSELTLDIDPKKYDIGKFDFSEIEDYVQALSSGRKYQFDAIRQIMVYLWGGRYESIEDLARQNFKKKEAIRQRFASETTLLSQIPLPGKLSGVCYMATGAGKSYVIFAIAYLSILLGKVKRVLVLGPPSTVIEQGLTEKFRDYMFSPKGLALREKLPEKYRNIQVSLCNANDIVDDYSIVIENINAVYTKGENAITDMLFKHTEEVLVLSDEVHHAYSHLKFGDAGVAFDFDGMNYGKGEDKNERLWMKFLRDNLLEDQKLSEETKIKRHIGFTGTPYNQNDFFPDVIFDYSIKDALEEGIIKRINPLLKIKTSDDDSDLTQDQRYEQIIQTHLDNKDRYSYGGLVKPISIFINNTQKAAQDNADKFYTVYSRYLSKHDPFYQGQTVNAIEGLLRNDKVVIVATSSANREDYLDQLNRIEETDPVKTGGRTEFIFAVNKLSEGWDVDNVFQIVPMQEKVFNSKLLISQVLGRGLRLPRQVSYFELKGNYPEVVITNHEKFGETVRNLLDEVRECDLIVSSKVFTSMDESPRFNHHFTLFNLDYDLVKEIVDKEPEQESNRSLTLKPQTSSMTADVQYLHGEKTFTLTKDFSSLDEVVLSVFRKMKNVEFENQRLNLDSSLDLSQLTNRDYIREAIRAAMNDAGITQEALTNENKKAVELYFNSFLPRGEKSIRFDRKVNLATALRTLEINASSVRAGALDQSSSLFVSDDWEKELSNEYHIFISELALISGKSADQTTIFDTGISDLDTDLIQKPFEGKRFFTVNLSAFKTPQNCVVCSHIPETNFIIGLIKHAAYLDSWIKSPDMGFYSLGYEYWKKGKDRVRRFFNPDFFIRIDLARYLTNCGKNMHDSDKRKLIDLQDQGIRELVCVVEIKADDDFEEVTNAKDEHGSSHFEELNKELKRANPIDLRLTSRETKDQHYSFFLLRADGFESWFRKLRNGALI